MPLTLKSFSSCKRVVDWIEGLTMVHLKMVQYHYWTFLVTSSSGFRGPLVLNSAFILACNTSSINLHMMPSHYTPPWSKVDFMWYFVSLWTSRVSSYDLLMLEGTSTHNYSYNSVPKILSLSVLWLLIKSSIRKPVECMMDYYWTSTL